MPYMNAKKFRTFSEAFDAVLKMPPEKILDAPHDPFIESVFRFLYPDEEIEDITSCNSESDKR
ncbi:MAG: hypothetical protein IJT59_00810 [Desulfovibrionaceae bacterium]|nr:hypothetical protein [Desulfovibrionaceae bacterium]